MAKAGPIIVVEDDFDDKDILQEILQELNITHPLLWFTNGNDAFNYLKTTTQHAFIILCDINLPRQTGIEFKRNVDNDPELRRKSIPFVFLSTSVDQYAVNEAYLQLTVQGYFQKSNNYQELKELIRVIMDYWKICHHPNSGD